MSNQNDAALFDVTLGLPTLYIPPGYGAPYYVNSFQYNDYLTIYMENADSNGIYDGSTGLSGALQAATDDAAEAPTIADAGTTDATQAAVYAIGPNGSYATYKGFDFTYSSTGILSGGFIQSITIDTPGSAADPSAGASEVSYDNLGIEAYYVGYYANATNPVEDLAFGAALYAVDAPVVHGNDGVNLFEVDGAGTTGSTTTIYGGGHYVETAEFAAYRSDALIINGGDNEAVVQNGITANLLGIDTLTFLDGSIYEDNGNFGAQAALMFEGILGRAPDPVNAGGFAYYASQYGLTAAGDLILATIEGQKDTAGLTDTQYVTLLYQNLQYSAPDQNGLKFYVMQLQSGVLTRGGVAAQLAAAPQTQIDNAKLFAGNHVFAADPSAVDVLRAYEVLLGRLPEVSSLTANTQDLDGGLKSLAVLYSEIQSSPEFAKDLHIAPNPYGLTATSSYEQVFAVTHSDAVTNLIAPLVTAAGGVAHQLG